MSEPYPLDADDPRWLAAPATLPTFEQIGGWVARLHEMEELPIPFACLDCGAEMDRRGMILCPCCQRPVCPACFLPGHLLGAYGQRVYCQHPAGNRIGPS